MKNSGRLYALLLMAVFLSAATAISAACLGTASKLSRQAYAQDIAMSYVQNIADILMETHACPDLPLYYSQDMKPCDENAAFYKIDAVYGGNDDYFYEGAVSLEELSSRDVLILLPVAWVVEIPGGDG